MKTTAFVLSLVTAMTSVSLNASPARADDAIARPTKRAAKEHFTAGNRLYRVREFEKAIDAYKAGALIEDLPIFSYNLAQCYRQLGRYDEAIWHYKLFLSRAEPPPQMKQSIDGFIDQMNAEKAKRAMTQPPVEPAGEAKPQPAPAPREDATSKVESMKPWYADSLGWSLAGVGMVGAGVSVGLLLNANNLDDEANLTGNTDRRQELRNRADDRRTLGAVIGVAGTAALAAGIVKLVLYPKDDRTATTATRLGVSSQGLVVMGRF